MTWRCFVAAVSLCATLTGSVSAADAIDATVAAPGAAVHPYGLQVNPWISKTVPASVRDKLESAFQLAVRRVREVPECNQMFNRLDEDGVEILRATLYYPSSPALEAQLNRAAAFTQVGKSVTYLCRRFSRLPKESAAILVIHEALHHAGLTEAPADRNGPRPREIDGMVAGACGL